MAPRDGVLLGEKAIAPLEQSGQARFRMGAILETYFVKRR
jgi:hypothetical protein